MPRFAAGPREIRDLVARDADRGEPLDGDFVEGGGRVFGGGVGGAVADAAEQHFLAEAAVLVHLQHVDGDVRRARGARSSRAIRARLASVWPERPAIRSILMLPMPASRSMRDFRGDDRGGVLAAGAADFRVDERLDAEADAVDAGVDPGARLVGGDACRARLRGWLRARGGRGCRSRRPREGVAGRGCWGCRRRDRRSRACHCQACAEISRSQRVEITRLQFARKDARGEIAVGTLLRAEGIGEVDSWHVTFIVAVTKRQVRLCAVAHRCYAECAGRFLGQAAPLRELMPRR